MEPEFPLPVSESAERPRLDSCLPAHRSPSQSFFFFLSFLLTSFLHFLYFFPFPSLIQCRQRPATDVCVCVLGMLSDLPTWSVYGWF